MRSKTGYSLALQCLSAVLVAALPALAQSTATLRGTVADTQGAALPGANITVRRQATGEGGPPSPTGTECVASPPWPRASTGSR